MKKKIICSSVLAALLSASSIALAGGIEVIPEPDYFTGLYVGGIGGVHHNTFNGSSSLTLNEPIEAISSITFLQQALDSVEIRDGWVSDDIGGGEYNGYGGVQGGFGKVFARQFYIGLQGFGEWGNSSETSTQTASGAVNNFPLAVFGAILPGDTANASGTITEKTRMEINNDYGIAGKLGWVVAPRSMIYGKVGAAWADLKVKNTTSTNAQIVTFDAAAPAVILSTNSTSLSASSSNEQTKIGLLLGIGFEQFVYRDLLSVNVEYTYVNYGSVTTTTPDLSGTFTTNMVTEFITPGTFGLTTPVNGESTARVITSSLMAGLNFYFGRNWL
jgi:opacity protein-like surface antigen